ncbi:prolipoprotein diacylglyceryl transferase, partial [Candidatus Uhrbacteria bacterium]|nr:prolipoprotein diacylglyceryl transferase [Candidatus Uhrbacteria bacterium]
MLPYWHYPTYAIFGVTFQSWGTLVALGILVAVFIARDRARRAGVQVAHVWDAAFWIIVAAFVGARLGHVFFYEWEYFLENLGDIFKIWHGGFSSYGGFAGAIIAFFVIARSRATKQSLSFPRTREASVLDPRVNPEDDMRRSPRSLRS